MNETKIKNIFNARGRRGAKAPSLGPSKPGKLMKNIFNPPRHRGCKAPRHDRRPG